MATLRRIGPDQHRHVPWRNGAGTTAEVVAEPGPGGRFRFRLSIAEVGASGPFSDFAGYERHILMLEGDGFTLHVEGDAPRVLDRPLVSFTFDGGRPARCELHGGPVRDLNLMVDRAHGLGSLRGAHLAAGEGLHLPLAGVVLLHVASGSIEVGPMRLAAGDTLRMDGGVQRRIAVSTPGTADVVIATVDPAPSR